jgi:hypothetical protein
MQSAFTATEIEEEPLKVRISSLNGSITFQLRL